MVLISIKKTHLFSINLWADPWGELNAPTQWLRSHCLQQGGPEPQDGCRNTRRRPRDETETIFKQRSCKCSLTERLQIINVFCSHVGKYIPLHWIKLYPNVAVWLVESSDPVPQTVLSVPNTLLETMGIRRWRNRTFLSRLEQWFPRPGMWVFSGQKASKDPRKFPGRETWAGSNSLERELLLIPPLPHKIYLFFKICNWLTLH